jgi:N-acetylneuraminate synthase
MSEELTIGKRKIGRDNPIYFVAEVSANHNQDFDQAVKIIHAAKEAGADAIKLQTYTPDTITIDCDNAHFRIGEGGLWAGRRLYDLYGEAFTPWEWQPRLRNIAMDLGMELFSTPFDSTAVDFLEKMEVPIYKVASCELVDLPLIQRVARTGKPLIMSTGMATFDEIKEALHTARAAGAKEIALLKCTSAYPAPPEEMNLRTIPHMADTFKVPVGLSDHTLGITVPIAAAALGACLIEKHVTLSRTIPGPDSAFSLEPHEFKAMVESIRIVEMALGEVNYDLTETEKATQVYRRSLFVISDMQTGDVFSEENVRSIRPGYGLHTRHMSAVLGKKAKKAIRKGTPLHWDLME